LLSSFQTARLGSTTPAPPASFPITIILFHKNTFYVKLELVNFREISLGNNLCSLSRVLCYQPAIEQPDGAPHTHWPCQSMSNIEKRRYTWTL
jgi:hypothetical protein